MDSNNTKQVKEPIRLLLVDDEEGYVNVLANRMALRGVDVSKAYSGSDAIKILRKNDFDVAVLDLKMEDMDGIEVLKIFKKMDPELETLTTLTRATLTHQIFAICGIKIQASIDQ